MMTFKNPSREDAWNLTRTEKMSLTFLMNAASALAEAKDDLADRLGRIDGGRERMEKLVEESLSLLTDVRMTIPEKQRQNLANTAMDYEMRMVPKLTPTSTNVIVQKEEFRAMVDAAQEKCGACADLNEECGKCKLFRLLTVVLPLDSYDGTILCPYNRAEWGN